MGWRSSKAIHERKGAPGSEVAAVGATLIGIVAFLIVFVMRPAMAQESEERAPRWDSAGCLTCHDESAETLTFPSGEEISIEVDGDGYLATPHAEIGVQCVHCHTSIIRVPHEPITVPDAASFSASLSTSCSQCHWRQYTIALDQAHALLPSESRNEAPTCVDCHDPHTAQAVAIEHPTMQAACDECHSGPLEDDVAAVHVFNPIATERADPPPLILFYGLILGAVVAFVGVVWAAVAIIQRVGRRSASSPA
jgi:hypothetical protein